MKKRLILLVLLAGILAVSTNSYSAGKYGLDGAGIYGNFAGEGNAPGGGVGLTLKFGNFPVLGVEWSLNSNGYSVIGVTFDWWIHTQAIGSGFFWYTGVGGYVGFFVDQDYFDFDLGLRGLIGLQFFPIKSIELFLEFAPMLTFISKNGDNYQLSPNIGYGLRLGIRWRF